MAKHLALFNGSDTAGNSGLWVTDGTAAGTFELTTFVLGHQVPVVLSPFNLTFFNGEVLFQGVDPFGGQKGLWVTNGTAAGTCRPDGPGHIGGRSDRLWPE
jgi:ELWxxDGT repeat protein